MIFGVTLLLLLNFAEFGQMFIHPDGNCDFIETLSNQQITFFKNPNWPATYMPGSTCRWTFNCPNWHACRLRCFDVGLPQTDDCYMDKLLVSGTGSPQLAGAQVFCGRTEINFVSVGSKLSLALVASPLSPGGRFRCTIRSEPWRQPWFVSTSTVNPKLQNETVNEIENKANHLKGINTLSRVNDKDTHVNMSRVPHTGLVQSRISYAKYELERAPHTKNLYVQGIQPGKPSHGMYVSKESTRPKYVKAESTYIDHVDNELAFVKSIKPGPVYQGHVDHRPNRIEKILKTPSKYARIGSSMDDNIPAGFLSSNSIVVESPFVIPLEEDLPAMAVMQELEAGKQYDGRVQRQPELAHQKHKVSREALSSHTIRTHGGTRRGKPVSVVKPGTRHVRHELIREPKTSRNRRLKADIHRITHRTGLPLPNTKRVRTHIKHTTKQASDAPYSRGVKSNNGRPVDVFSNGL